MRLPLTEDELGEVLYALAQRREFCAGEAGKARALAMLAHGPAAGKFAEQQRYWNERAGRAASAQRKLLEMEVTE